MANKPEHVVSVELVRSNKDSLARIISGLLGLFTASWMVMLVLGTVHATYARVPHPSYWLTVGSLYGLRCAVGYVSGQYETRYAKVK